MTTKAKSGGDLLPSEGPLYVALSGIYVAMALHVLYRACIAAYEIRLYAINEYGRVIHEFDPYFNYRATEYLWQHGAKAFFHWFDYQSWYPLGRPVGTTIFPGMQFTAVWIKQFILPDWSINDICCFVPAWFGACATLATAALCYTTVSSIRYAKGSKSILLDVPGVSSITKVFVIPLLQFFQSLLFKTTKSTWGIATMREPPALESAIFTALIMSIVPAHLLRSVGGGYDNESVATTAMQLTFWMWTLTLSTDSLTMCIPLGVLTGICYFYMVAAWGGYVFVINLIGVHALFVFVFRKTSWDHLYRSYTSFYIVGTLLAMQIPVVNWAPIKSLEQLGPFGLFAGFQILQLMRTLEQRYPQVNKWKIRARVVLGALAVALPVMFVLYSRGYFGPISSRIRGLFVEHTKTGNPLVDSVAEHQAASPEAYFQYLNVICHIAPIGFAIIALVGCTASSSFLILYGLTAYFFSHKMVRLILLTAPIASVCGGIALGYGWAWVVGAIFGDNRPCLDIFLCPESYEESKALAAEEKEELSSKAKKGKAKKTFKVPPKKVETEESKNSNDEEEEKSGTGGDAIWTRAIRLMVGFFIIQGLFPLAQEFQRRCYEMAEGISHPTIMHKARHQGTGEVVIIDDYREAYWWLRDNTPEDARIMAWWDYGYQITGIANRTTIADGNTWNHEHIALLGRILTSPEKEAHRIARHLADYVLVWTGGGGDDVAKSPHLRRIANSVYRGLCQDPLCRSFGMMREGIPTQSLGASLLYKLHSNGLEPGVVADKNRFREVFRSQHAKVRIYKIQSVSQESKQWVLDNRKCDVPGSWYCPGHYPPALEKILKERKDFRQLEDFNKGRGGDEEYQQQYFENLNNKQGVPEEKRRIDPNSLPKVPWDEIEMINEEWEDNAYTTGMWEIISGGRFNDFLELMVSNPQVAHIRSADGRGPLWWAKEYNRPKMYNILLRVGVSEQRTDKNGIKPTDL